MSDSFETQVLDISRDDPFVTWYLSDRKGEKSGPTDDHPLLIAKSQLQSGHTVGIPTETVYGLAANAFDENAVRSIFTVKGRPSDNPLIVHVSSLDMLHSLLPNEYTLPNLYTELMSRFWPGPLTLLVPRSQKISTLVSGGHDTVAVRMPSHPIGRALIEACGFPLAAPSANLSGRPSPTLAQHVYSDLKGRIPLILDGGPCVSGVESTVLDGLRPVPAILRPGGITVEQLKAIPECQSVVVYSKHFTDPALAAAPTTPGMKYLHYTPSVPVVLFDTRHSDVDSSTIAKNLVLRQMREHVYQFLVRNNSQYEKIGYMSVGETSFEDHLQVSNSVLTMNLIEYRLGSSTKEIAQSIFAGLRHLEGLCVDVICVEGISEDEEGLAVMNRLRKAASRIVEI